MASIDAIDDIGARHRSRLTAADLSSCEALLEAGATRRGRRIIAETVGVAETRVLEWVHKADLIRIRGISTRYSQLLEAVGVDSVRKLKKCRPTQLYRSLVLENSQRRKRLVGRAPSAKQVGQWVKQARRLPQLVK